MKRIYLLLLAVMAINIGVFCASPHVFGQQPSSPAAASEARGKAPKDKTFFEVLKQGGFMMIPMGAVSVLMFTLVLDSFNRLRNHKLAPPQLLEELRNRFRHGDYNGAYACCKNYPSVLGSVVGTGLSMVGHGKDATERAMEDALAKEISALGTRVRYLSVIGVVSPMLGLTGTVLGMIRAFATLGQSGISDPSALAAAIGEVLVATATGLFVAIPAFGAYYVFGNRITATVAHTEDVINGLFRGMPYGLMIGAQIGDEPIYAAAPNSDLQRVSESTDMVACPTCKEPVTIGVAACPHCQSKLNWQQ